MRTPASSWAAPSASRSTRTPILTTIRTRCPTPRSRRPDGRRGGGSRATTHGDGRTGSGCHRTSADMPTAQAPLKRRIVAGTLAPASSADAQRRGGFSHHGSMGHGFGGHRPFFHSHPRSRFFIDGGFFFDPFFFPYYYPYYAPYPVEPYLPDDEGWSEPPPEG